MYRLIHVVQSVRCGEFTWCWCRTAGWPPASMSQSLFAGADLHTCTIRRTFHGMCFFHFWYSLLTYLTKHMFRSWALNVYKWIWHTRKTFLPAIGRKLHIYILNFQDLTTLHSFLRVLEVHPHFPLVSLNWVTARCVLSVVILPITTQQCKNYLYDKSWPNRWYQVGGLVGGNVS